MHDNARVQSGFDMEVPQQTALKVGLLIDSMRQPQWVYDIIDEIQRSDFARIALIVENGDVEQPERRFARKLWTQRHRIGYALYSRLDARLFRREPDAFTERPIDELVDGVPRLRVTPIKKKWSDFFQPEDVAAIRAHDLDVVLRLGFRILRGDALQIARHGVWSYHHGDNLVNRGSPPGFWEVMDNEPVTGSVLQILSDDLDNGRVIYRSHAPTDRRSVRRNQENYYRKSAAFVVRKLRDLAEEGEAALAHDPHADVYMPYTRRLYKEPTNAEMVKLGMRLAARYVSDKARSAFYRDSWALAYRMHPGAAGPDPGFHRYKLLMPPRDRFWADPFPVATDNGFVIFVEELPFRTNKGHITALHVDRQGTIGQQETVLEKPYHLSYPFVFEWRGEQFMIPETGANRTIELYRATEFPRGWTLEHVLLQDLYAVDATLIELDGRWWMFVNVAREGVLNDDELHVFHAVAPFGPWRPVRRNPVKSDARCARPAGRLFWWRGSLYRPSQDCSGRYGSAMVINKVERLTTTEFIERPVSRIEAKWAPRLLGTHTLNSAPGMTVADVLIRRSRLL